MKWLAPSMALIATTHATTTALRLSTAAVASPTLFPSRSSTVSPSPAELINYTNSTSTADVTLSVYMPPLVQCASVTFTFTSPPLPKTCAFFVSGTTTFIETILLGPQYDGFTSGTFQWRVDLPVGLEISAQFWVTENGKLLTASTPSAVVIAGTDSSCIAANKGQNTLSVISYASALNSSYVYVPPTIPGSSTSPPLGPIIGGVIGGVLLISLLALYLFYNRRQHRLLESRRMSSSDSYSVYSHATHEKPPEGGYWTTQQGMVDEYGRPLHPQTGGGEYYPPTPTTGGMGGAQVPRMTAPVGTLPEPMDAEDR